MSNDTNVCRVDKQASTEKELKNVFDQEAAFEAKLRSARTKIWAKMKEIIAVYQKQKKYPEEATSELKLASSMWEAA